MAAGGAAANVPFSKAWLDTFQVSPVNVVPPRLPPLLDQVYRPSLPIPIDTNAIFDKFRMVKTRTYQQWKKISPVDWYCKHIENTFWHALSLAIHGHEQHWASVKSEVHTFYTAVMAAGAAGAAHPRLADYILLGTTATLKAAPANMNVPVGTFLQQVSPQPGPGGDPVPKHAVSAELWQVVADALDIELCVIIDQAIPNDMFGQKLMVARGNHNSKQIFLLLENDGEYRAVTPADSRNPHNYRFEWMKDVEHNITAQDNIQQTRWDDAVEVADEKNSPFTVVDLWQRPLGIPHMPTPPAMGGVLPVSIGAPHVAPFRAPDALVADPLRTGATVPQVMLNLNCTSWP